MSDSETQCELTITDVVYRGKGLARLDGCVYFVPGALPGERVRASIVARRKRYVDARVEEVLEPSPHRRDTVCPLAGTCPGCSYQHAVYPEELRLKQRQLEDLLTRMGHVTGVTWRDPVGAPAPLGYRNKLVLHPVKSDTGMLLGYFGEDNRTILDVPRCALAADGINDALLALREKSGALESLKRRTGLTLRYTPHDGVASWQGDADPTAESLHETTAIGELDVPRGSFFQVNTAVADLILQAMVERVAEAAPRYAIDLYCGVGVHALAAGRAGVGNVLGVDTDGNAIAAAMRNAESLGLDQVEFRQAAAAGVIRRSLKAVPSAKTAVIADPPRRGLDRAVREVLCDLKPAHLFYVSCAADTLARDLVALQEAGYAVRDVTLFDMFPRTPYFETLVWLTMGEGDA